MPHALRDLLHRRREVLLYLVFGVLTTAVNYLVYLLCRWLLPDTALYMAVGNTAAWVMSVLFAYYTNRRFVFQSGNSASGAKRREFLAFLSARVFSLFLDQGVLLAGVLLLGLNDLLVKLAANVLVVAVNYFLSKFLIFRKQS